MANKLSVNMTFIPDSKVYSYNILQWRRKLKNIGGINIDRWG